MNLAAYNPRARYLTGLGAGSRTARRIRARRTLMLGDGQDDFNWTQSTAAPTVAPIVPTGTFLSPTDLNLPDASPPAPTVIYMPPTAAQLNVPAPANTAVAQNPITGALTAAPKAGYAISPTGQAVPAISVGSTGLSTSTLLLIGGGILLIAAIASSR